MTSRQLAAFAASVQKKYGEDRVRNRVPPVIVSTGSLALDWALRYGGLELGTISEITGPKDTGKSTLGISCAIQHLKRFEDRGVGYVNMEDTFDPGRATAMGLDCSAEAIAAGRWIPVLPEHSEHVSDMARDMVSSGFMSLVIVDSIGAMESDRTLGKKAADAADAVGRNAKIITQMIKALSTLARLNHCTVLLINQPRAMIGGTGGDISAGPKLLQHATTVKIDMKALGDEDSGDLRKLRLEGEDTPLIVSSRTRMKVSRMKNGLTGRVAESYINRISTDIYGPAGFDTADEYITLGVREQIIAQGGGWYTLPDGKTKFQGREKLAAAIRADPGLQKVIRAAIKFEVPVDDEETTDAPQATDSEDGRSPRGVPGPDQRRDEEPRERVSVVRAGRRAK